MAVRVLVRNLAVFAPFSRHRLVANARTRPPPAEVIVTTGPKPLCLLTRKMTSQTDSRAEMEAPVVEVGEREGGKSEGQGDSGEGVSGEEGEKYPYLQRGFTSEIFKIEIQNIPKYIGYSELKKKLEKLGLKPVKIKKPQRFQSQPHCFVTFRSEEDRECALEALKGVVWKNKTVTAKVAAPSVDPLYRQRNKRRAAGGGSGGESVAKRAHLDREESQLSLRQRLDRVVTPLLGTAYESQLASKTAQIRQALQKAAYLIGKEESNPGEEFRRQVGASQGMMCELKPILASPLQTGYRNKAEFSIGTAPDKTPGSPPTRHSLYCWPHFQKKALASILVVGFRLGSYEDAEFTVVSPEECSHIPQRMKELCRVFEEFFKTSSLAPYRASDESGYWRQVAVRCYTTGETMAVVMIHPQSLTQEEMETEKKRLVEFFRTGPGSTRSPSSLYLHTFSRKTKEHILDVDHLLGETHVHEELLGLRFRISPDAFFQTNSPATELLYRQVRDLCRHGNHSSEVSDVESLEAPTPAIYDICCGTGTIGLYLSKALAAKRVVGVELNKQAVEDARVNAQLNGVEEVEFVCGRAEDVLQRQLEEEAGEGSSGEVIGIVDPPRAGLHPRVVQCIRRCSRIQKLIYVSCNPEGHQTLGNFVDLCRRPSLRVKGVPFSPVVAVPVDLFPHTPHCELIVLFQREGPTNSTTASLSASGD